LGNFGLRRARRAQRWWLHLCRHWYLAGLGRLTKHLDSQHALWGFGRRIDMKSRQYDGVTSQHAAHQ
jgi:hypothetical protein